ncbi:hypothetical protein VFPPC_18729 [Pochonia chlamydosporia 170]|uniref:Uncharacterized protein n=1 Tax=Pochonia chlamydosporia 170 TaxID=1380566 RepID=A0A219ATD9_METCM|nr:hypothetical protein VFPPC_18729 [Pochonia chlamydosporia 170]OWT43544.1 hypothetical protein VFPPC_18729 [Pochonia chlamydosporia 170]
MPGLTHSQDNMQTNEALCLNRTGLYRPIPCICVTSHLAQQAQPSGMQCGTQVIGIVLSPLFNVSTFPCVLRMTHNISDMRLCVKMMESGSSSTCTYNNLQAISISTPVLRLLLLHLRPIFAKVWTADCGLCSLLKLLRTTQLIIHSLVSFCCWPRVPLLFPSSKVSLLRCEAGSARSTSPLSSLCPLLLVLLPLLGNTATGGKAKVCLIGGTILVLARSLATSALQKGGALNISDGVAKTKKLLEMGSSLSVPNIHDSLVRANHQALTLQNLPMLFLPAE